MSQKVLQRQFQAGAGLEKALAATRNPTAPTPIANPPEDVPTIQSECDSFTLASFTTEDALELGYLLYARLLPYAQKGRSTVISIASANSNQILFQSVVGSGTAPDNERWVARKRNSVLRFGTSSWLLNRRYNGDEPAFCAKFGISTEQYSNYAIHGGCIPIRVQGFDGIVATVTVSGLKQHEDHGVICDIIRENWN